MLHDAYDAVLNASSAVSAFIAAALWFRSATVAVPHDAGHLDPDDWAPAAITRDGAKGKASIDVLATAQEANRWNAYAAFTAAIAAVLQVASALL